MAGQLVLRLLNARWVRCEVQERHASLLLSEDLLVGCHLGAQQGRIGGEVEHVLWHSWLKHGALLELAEQIKVIG